MGVWTSRSIPDLTLAGHKLKVILRWNQLLSVVDWTSTYAPPCRRLVLGEGTKEQEPSFFETVTYTSLFRRAIFFQNSEFFFKIWLNYKKSICFQAFQHRAWANTVRKKQFPSYSILAGTLQDLAELGWKSLPLNSQQGIELQFLTPQEMILIIRPSGIAE